MTETIGTDRRAIDMIYLFSYSRTKRQKVKRPKKKTGPNYREKKSNIEPNWMQLKWKLSKNFLFKSINRIDCFVAISNFCSISIR